MKTIIEMAQTGLTIVNLTGHPIPAPYGAEWPSCSVIVQKGDGTLLRENLEEGWHLGGMPDAEAGTVYVVPAGVLHHPELVGRADVFDADGNAPCAADTIVGNCSHCGGEIHAAAPERCSNCHQEVAA